MLSPNIAHKKSPRDDFQVGMDELCTAHKMPVHESFIKLLEIRDTGTSILMVEQNATMALEISDRGYVLELGQNKYEGTGKELLKDPKVGELYLGRSH